MNRLLISLFAVGAIASAQADTSSDAKAFNASFWAPEHQLVPASEDIRGLRLNVYGENKNVTGVDIGFGNSVTGDMNGAQLNIFGVYNYVGGKLNGAQLGLVNQTGHEVNGASLGLVNYNKVADSKLTGADLGFVNWTPTTDVTGAQLGFVNNAHNVKGVQLGFVNIAQHLNGVQLGLWNQVSEREWEFKPLPKVFPFINVGW